MEKWTGKKVKVYKDDGSIFETVARSEPWKLGDGTSVIAVEGIAGGYLLSRVVKVDQ